MKSLRVACVVGLLATGGCGSDPAQVGDEADLTQKGVVCQNPAAQPNVVLDDATARQKGALDSKGNTVLSNWTAWPVYAPGAQTVDIDAAVIEKRTDPLDARDNLADRFGACSPKVAKHLGSARPNVYIYFTGFGGAAQNNSVVDQGAIVRWINQRDPKGLIFSINWSCAASGDGFCSANTKAIAPTAASPEMQSVARSLEAFGASQLMGIVQQLGQQQQGYDSALSHSMQLAAQLVDQLLVADQGPNGESLIGDIHFAGYSMGAHAAAQVLVQDFTSDASVGFPWTRAMCEGGGSVCTIAELTKVKWSLALGLSGWSHALLAYNEVDAGGVAHRDPADAAQFENGGLLRIRDAAYRNKLNVFNRRMDPTGNSDDTFQRGLGDILYGDYNHQSHDYALPLFIEPAFVRVLDAFVESPDAEDEKELGIVFDHAGYVDFDDCPATGKCSTSTGYLAHAMNRSHQTIGITDTKEIATVAGAPHPDRKKSRAVTFTAAGAQPIELRTFDQEDLRGGVELRFKPKSDPGGAGVRGLFSYGSCEGSDADVMPQAWFEDGRLVFSMAWQGETYQVDVAASSVPKAKWTHLAFTWELPVESLTVPHANKADVVASMGAMAADVEKHESALVLANGLRKPLPTTYKRQAGAGVMRIFVNGEMAAEGALGTASSSRACLAAADVLNTSSYEVDGQTYPPYGPYARYDTATGDVVALGPSQVLGTKCKAYRIRNERALFGCAKSQGVNAQGDMDDIVLVWGPGRMEYHDVVEGTGAAALWPIGATYDAKPFKH